MLEDDAGRRSRLLGGGGGPARNVSIAVLSTVVVLAAILVTVVNSPGWPRVKSAFFNSAEGRDTFSSNARATSGNV